MNDPIIHDLIIHAPLSKIVEAIINEIFGNELPETSRVQWHRDRITTALASLESSEREVLEFLKKLPLPLPSNHKLVIWANQIRGFYGHPVYLVGSQTTGKENPRDVDVVCGIPDSEFTLRYGDVNEWLEQGATGKWTDVRWNWADDCSKRSIDGMECTGFLIDFKVQPMAQFNGFAHIPKIRLDTKK